MQQKFVLSPRPYSVIAIQDEMSAEQCRGIAMAYVESIEESLESPDIVARCFAAWEKEMRVGILTLSRAEINDAARWRAAHVAAFESATSRMTLEGALEIVLRLR